MTQNHYLECLSTYHQKLDLTPANLQTMFIDLRIYPLNWFAQRDPIPLLGLPTVINIDATQIFFKTSGAAILGEPGAGKTTLLKYLTLLCTQDKTEMLGLSAAVLPILIDLSDFAAQRAQVNSPYSLLDHLNAQTRQRLGLELSPNFFLEALKQGRCLVCLDGLDTVCPVGVRGAVCDQIEALLNRYPGNYYLVTSRIAGYDQAPLNPSIFNHYRLLPFACQDIEEFITTWYTALKPRSKKQAKIDDFLHNIWDKPLVCDLAHNPLLLTLLAQLHQAGVDLPQERAQLYDQIINLWLGSAPSQRRLLERLAYMLYTGAAESAHGVTVRYSELERVLDLLTDERGSDSASTEWLAKIGEQPGPLVKRGDELVGFIHRTFQEFLVACDIYQRHLEIDKAAIWSEIQDRVREAHWLQVILLLLGKLNGRQGQSTHLLQQILTAGENDPLEAMLHRHLIVVAQSLANQTKVEPDMGQKVVGKLVKLAQEGQPWERESAFGALVKLRRETCANDELLNLARDTRIDLGLRSQAICTLETLGCADEQVFAGLVTLARDEQLDELIRRDAVNTMGQLGRVNQTAHPHLLALAQDKSVSAWVRCDAANALEQLDHFEQAVNVLLTLAQDDQADDLVRCIAVSALGNLAEPSKQVLDVLLRMAQDKQLSSGVRSDLVRALGNLGHADARVLDVLLVLVRDAQVDDLVRGDVAGALSQLGRSDERVLNSLLTLIQDAQASSWVRSAAAGALGQIGLADERVLNSLAALAQDKQVDVWVHQVAASTLNLLQEKEVLAGV